MENMNYLVYVLYVCIAVPVALMLLVLDRKNRLIMLYLLFGLTATISVGRLNRMINIYICGGNNFYSATTFAPITEELAKGIPVIILCTFAKKIPPKKLLACAYASGLGFAILENVIYFCNYHETINLLWALLRGIGAGTMHSLTTSIVALGIIISRKYKKLYWSFLFSFLCFAMVYHGTFNSLVSCNVGLLQNIGIFMPISTLIPTAIYIAIKRYKEKKKKEQTT